MKLYNVLLVDADDTLLDFGLAEENALRAACADMGVSITDAHAARYKEINEALWRAFERREVTQEALRTLRFTRFFGEIGVTADVDAMAEAYIAALSLQAHEIDGAYDFLREAAARVPVIVVTNGIASVQRSRFALSRLKGFLSGHVISGEVGFAKPDPRMIERALSQVAVAGPRPLMLGDSLRSDIAAANAAGIASCWFNPAGHENNTPHTPTHEVRALSEVLEWL